MTGTAAVRAQSLIQLRRWADAAAAARAGLATTPDDPALQLLLAIALTEVGDHLTAIDAAERAVAQQPERGRAHRVLGWSYYKAGRLDAATQSLSTAATLEPTDALARVMLGEVLLRSARLTPKVLRGSGVLATVDGHGAEAIRLEPDEPGGYLIRAKACAGGGDAAGTERWAREALQRRPDDPVGHQLLGIAAQLRGETGAAADHFVAAGRLDPTRSGSMTLAARPAHQAADGRAPRVHHRPTRDSAVP